MRCTIPVPFSSWRLPYLALLLAATASTTTSIFATKIPHPPQTPTRQPPIPSILAAPIAIIHHQAVPVALHLIPILATIITTAPGKSKTPSFSLSNPYRLLMAPSPEATKSASSVLHLPKTASSILGKRKAQNYSSSINKSSAPLFHKADPDASTSYGNKATKKSLCQTASATTKHSPSTTSRQISSSKATTYPSPSLALVSIQRRDSPLFHRHKIPHPPALLQIPRPNNSPSTTYESFPTPKYKAHCPKSPLALMTSSLPAPTALQPLKISSPSSQN